MKSPKHLVREIHRRSLWQVLGIYVVGSWFVLQIVDTLAGALNLPDWAPSLATFLLIIGLPIVLATAFVQEGGRPHGGDDADDAAGSATPDEPARVKPDGGARPRLLTWRTAIGGGVAAFALWGMIALGWLLLGGSPTSDGVQRDTAVAGPLSSSVIVVLPFTFRGSGEQEYLGEGMVSLIGTKLDGAGDLRSVDSRALLSHVHQDDSIDGDPDRAASVARRFGAGLFVLGDIVEAGGQLQVSATLYDTETGTPRVDAAASGTDAFTLVDELATRLLAGIEGGPGARVRRIAGVTTASLPAFRAYLEGEEAFRQGNFDAAVEAFERAVAEDSVYALAYYRLSVAAEWATRPELSEEAAEAAGRFAHRLSDRDQRQLEAATAWRRGRFDEAERLYRSIVGTYPDDVEAWFQLGEVLFHANGLRGRSFEESEDAFRRVLTFVPDHAAAILHMARLYAWSGKREELDSVSRQFAEAYQTSDRIYPLMSLRVYGLGRSVAEDSLLTELAAATDLNMVQATWAVGTFARDLEGATRIAKLFTGPGFSTDVRTTGSSYVAHYLAAMGRYQEAAREMQTVSGFDAASAAQYGALIAVMPLSPVSEDEMRRLLSELDNDTLRGAPTSRNPSMFFNINDDIQDLIRPYLAGLLSVRLGDTRRALEYAAILEALPVSAGRATLPADLAAGVRGAAALADRQPEVALEALERVQQHFLYNVTLVSPYYNMAFQRFQRAEALRELGRLEEAAGWYEHIADAMVDELPYRPAAHYRLGQIYEELGEPATARSQYEAFLELWVDADPALQPLVDEVRARVAGLPD